MSNVKSEELKRCKYITNSLVTAAVLTAFLVLILYVHSLIVENIGIIDAFFTLDIEFLNIFLVIVYTNIFVLTSSSIILISARSELNTITWYVVLAVSILTYIILMAIYCNSYWDVKNITTFQSNLTTFIWLPVWCFVILVFVILSEIHRESKK